MTPWFAGRRFWLVDVLDAYSRYLVHPCLTGRAGCEVLLTARADVLQLAVQRGLETLDGRLRIPGEPEIVHDRGPKFLAREWRAFVDAVGMTDVTTRAHHPQSNGRDERFHRTFREEVPIDADHELYRVRELIQARQIWYNEGGPRSALNCLCPIDYYRGNPEARLAERERKLQFAAATRRKYWGP